MCDNVKPRKSFNHIALLCKWEFVFLCLCRQNEGDHQHAGVAATSTYTSIASPKVWHELKAVTSLLKDMVFKPANLGGAGWPPHISKALQMLGKNFNPVIMYAENSIETSARPTEMQARAWIMKRMLIDHINLLFVTSCWASWMCSIGRIELLKLQLRECTKE